MRTLRKEPAGSDTFVLAAGGPWRRNRCSGTVHVVGRSSASPGARGAGRPIGCRPGYPRSRMRALCLPLAFCVLSMGPSARADGTTTAADATEPGRRLDRALDIVLDGAARSAGGPRTLCLVIDPSPSLAAAGFADRLDAALERNAEKLSSTEIAVLKVGEKEAVLLSPTADRAAAGSAVRASLVGAKNVVRNVYADVRAAAALLGGRTRRPRDAAGDARERRRRGRPRGHRLGASPREGADVRPRHARRSSPTRYAASHATKAGAPKGSTWTGGDGAFAEIPWGWLFQTSNGNEAAASGFASYGLTRLCAGHRGAAVPRVRRDDLGDPLLHDPRHVHALRGRPRGHGRGLPADAPEGLGPARRAAGGRVRRRGARPVLARRPRRVEGRERCRARAQPAVARRLRAARRSRSAARPAGRGRPCSGNGLAFASMAGRGGQGARGVRPHPDGVRGRPRRRSRPTRAPRAGAPSRSTCG